MIRLRPVAEFRADFPDDQIEDGDRIIQFGGKTVTEAVAEIVRGLGYSIGDLLNEEEHGWQLEVKGENCSLWLQITDLADHMILDAMDATELFERSRSPRARQYAELLPRLNAALKLDGRFHDIKWYTRKNAQGEVGVDEPVSEEAAPERVKPPANAPGLISKIWSNIKRL
jgi:hypothetical protein